MPANALHAFPLHALPALVTFLLSPDGRYVDTFGTALGLLPPGARSRRGLHYETVLEKEPEAREVVRRALAGRCVARIVRCWSRVWFVLAEPEVEEGVVRVVRGTCFLVPDGADAGGLVVPDAEVYELAGDNARRGTWSGDRFVLRPDRDTVTMLRTLPREEWEAIRDDDPGRMHVIRSRASLPSPPPLRLLP